MRPQRWASAVRAVLDQAPWHRHGQDRGSGHAATATLLAARARARRWARWSSLAQTAPAIAGSCSACTGKARHRGPRGTPHGPQVRTGHSSRSCRDPSAGGVTSIEPRARPGRQGGELAHPAHPLGGRVGVIAELLRHPAGAAAALPNRRTVPVIASAPPRRSGHLMAAARRRTAPHTASFTFGRVTASCVEVGSPPAVLLVRFPGWFGCHEAPPVEPCTGTLTRRRVSAPQTIRMIAVDVQVRPLHRGSCEHGGQLCDGVPRKPRCQQRADDDPVGVQVTAGGEVRVKHTFQESKGPCEPGCLGEIGELPPGECLYPDPFAVRGSKIPGEAATGIAAGPVLMHPG